MPPFLRDLDSRWRYLQETIRYNKHCSLDVWSKNPDWQTSDAPMLVWIPGGGWTNGSRFTFQGHPLLTRMVKRGWTCAAIDYRTAPRHRWPVPLEDVQDAICWARERGPGFTAVAGGSAGGHLASLAGLQGYGDAVVSLYGSYDWETRASLWRHVFMSYLERWVVGKSQGHHPRLYHDASPMAQVHRLAPPFCLIHGSSDLLISICEARRFRDKLNEADVRTWWMEVPRGHGFDLYDAGYSEQAMHFAEVFLADMYFLQRGIGQPTLFSLP